MKKILFAASLMLIPVFSMAGEVWKSSNVATSHNFNALCTGNQRGFLHGICTDFGVASSSMTVYGSSWTTTAPYVIGPVSTFVADQCKYFDVNLGKGLGFQKTNTAVVTIMYECN